MLYFLDYFKMKLLRHDFGLTKKRGKFVFETEKPKEDDTQTIIRIDDIEISAKGNDSTPPPQEVEITPQMKVEFAQRIQAELHEDDEEPEQDTFPPSLILTPEITPDEDFLIGGDD